MESPTYNPLYRRIVFAGKALSSHFAAALASAGASLPMFTVLTQARSTPGLSQTELAERVGIEGPTLVRHLDRLCRDDLVVRRRDPLDRRVTRIELTESGQARHAELAKIAHGLDRQLRAVLGDEDCALLDRVLIRITEHLEETHDITNRH
jgi:MarR family transcriptional regulator, transcriptional regulator for hemolysin